MTDTALQWQFYRLTGFLGSGATGSVFLIEDTRTGQPYALKVLTEKNLRRRPERFLQMQHPLAGLQHPHLVRYVTSGLLRPSEVPEALSALRDLVATFSEPPTYLPFLVMEYHEGVPLSEYWGSFTERNNPTDWEQFLFILERVADAVDYLHRNRILHRDLKPENILVKEENNPVLLDLGGATQESMLRESRQSDSITGTMDYVAPEVFAGGAIDGRSDVYSLGVVAYKFFTDRVPLDHLGTAELLTTRKQVPPQDPLQFNSQLPPRMVQVLLTALHPKAGRRFPSCVAFAKALRESMSTLGSSAGVLKGLPVVKSRLYPTQAATLETLLEAVPRHEELPLPNFVLFEGVEGVGKSQVLAHYINQLEREGFLVFTSYAQQSSTGNRPAFSRIIQKMLYQYRALWREFPPLFQVCGGVLPRFFHNLTNNPTLQELPHTPALQQQAEEQRLGDLLLQLFQHLASHHSVALVIDDAHELTTLELNLLRYFHLVMQTSSKPNLRRVPSNPLVMLLCARYGGHSSRSFSQFRDTVLRTGRFTTVQLHPLPEEEIEVFVQREIGAVNFPKEVQRFLVSRSHGIPGRALALIEDLRFRNVVSYRGDTLHLNKAQWEEYVNQTPTERIDSVRVSKWPQTQLPLLRKLAVLHEGFTKEWALALLPELRPVLTNVLKRGLEISLFSQETYEDSTEEWRIADGDDARVLLNGLEEKDRRELNRRAAVLLQQNPKFLPYLAQGRIARLLERAHDLPGAINAAIEAGNAAREALDSDEAVAAYEKAAQLYMAIPPVERESIRVDLVSLYKRLAELFFNRGERESALEVFRTFGSIVPPEDRVELAIEGLSVAFTIYAEEGDFSTAEAYAWQAVKYAQETGSPTIQARALVRVASFLARSAREDQAQELLEQGVTLLEEVGDQPLELGGAFNVLGTLLRRKGETEQAAENFLKAQILFQKHGADHMRLAMTAQHLGSCLHELGHYEDSRKAFQRANDLFVQGAYLPGSGLTLNGMGNLYMDMGDMGKAAECFQRAVTIFENLQDERYQAMALNNLGECLVWGGRLLEAEQALEQSMALRKNQPDSRVLYTLANNASLRKAQGRYFEGVLPLENALNEMGGDGNQRLRLTCYHRLMELFAALGNLEQARHCHQISVSGEHTDQDPALPCLAELSWQRCLREHELYAEAEAANRILESNPLFPRIVRTNRRVQAIWEIEKLLQSLRRNPQKQIQPSVNELVENIDKCGYRLLIQELLLAVGMELTLNGRGEEAWDWLSQVREYGKEEQALEYFWMSSVLLGTIAHQQGKDASSQTLLRDGHRMLALLTDTTDDFHRESFLSHPVRKRLMGLILEHLA